MPRPVSWLPRLHEIRRSVQNSVRSHYDRRDLEQLFELQPRSAQNFFALLPSVPVGRSRLVEREALARFLDGVQEADDVPAYMERVRERGRGGLPEEDPVAGAGRPRPGQPRFPARLDEPLPRAPRDQLPVRRATRRGHADAGPRA